MCDHDSPIAEPRTPFSPLPNPLVVLSLVLPIMKFSGTWRDYSNPCHSYTIVTRSLVCMCTFQCCPQKLQEEKLSSAVIAAGEAIEEQACLDLADFILETAQRVDQLTSAAGKPCTPLTAGTPKSTSCCKVPCHSKASVTALTCAGPPFCNQKTYPTTIIIIIYQVFQPMLGTY